MAEFNKVREEKMDQKKLYVKPEIKKMNEKVPVVSGRPTAVPISPIVTSMMSVFP